MPLGLSGELVYRFPSDVKAALLKVSAAAAAREVGVTAGTKASSFLLLLVRPGATSSVLAPSSDALCY